MSQQAKLERELDEEEEDGQLQIHFNVNTRTRAENGNADKSSKGKHESAVARRRKAKAKAQSEEGLDTRPAWRDKPDYTLKHQGVIDPNSGEHVLSSCMTAGISPTAVCGGRGVCV